MKKSEMEAEGIKTPNLQRMFWQRHARCKEPDFKVIFGQASPGKPKEWFAKCPDCLIGVSVDLGHTLIQKKGEEQ